MVLHETSATRGGLGGQIRVELDAQHLDDTCQTLADAAQPNPDDEARRQEIRQRIAKLDRELDGYRSIVRSEPEAAATVGRWIVETAQERQRLRAFLGTKPSTGLTTDDIKALVASLRDITTTLASADPIDEAAVYEEMGIDLTYHDDGRVLVESRPRVVSDGVRGARSTPGTRHPSSADLAAA